MSPVQNEIILVFQNESFKHVGAHGKSFNLFLKQPPTLHVTFTKLMKFLKFLKFANHANEEGSFTPPCRVKL